MAGSLFGQLGGQISGGAGSTLGFQPQKNFLGPAPNSKIGSLLGQIGQGFGGKGAINPAAKAGQLFGQVPLPQKSFANISQQGLQGLARLGGLSSGGGSGIGKSLGNITPEGLRSLGLSAGIGFNGLNRAKMSEEMMLELLIRQTRQQQQDDGLMDILAALGVI